jgi:lysophospholipase L1-like esterase
MPKRFLAIVLCLFSIATCLAQQSLIQNGNMEAGADKPDGWSTQGVAHIERDTIVVRSAPASLRVEWQDGSGGTFQRLNPNPSGSFTVKGYTRVEGTFEVSQVALQFFDATRKQIGWKVISLLKSSGDWTEFHGQFTPPPSTAGTLLVVAAKGTGRIWLDDVTVDGDGTAQAAQSPTSTETAAAAPEEATPLPQAITASDPHLLYSGRFDLGKPAAPRCAWPASAVALHFKGRSANVNLTAQSQVRWQVYIDGKPGAVLLCNGKPQLLSLAKDLPDGEHTIVLLKRTESLFGIATINGFQLNEGAELLAAAAPARKIEVIGDSISAGFGDEAANQNEKFSPVTENAGIAYGALAARSLQADYTCIAWSGKTLWGHEKAIPDIYDRIIPQEAASQWDFSRWQPDVVVINLGTNDFSPGNPDEESWVAAYKEFIARIRKNYPKAYIFCAVSPMLVDKYSKSKNARTTFTAYINRVITECSKVGETKVALVEFPEQTGALGFGAAWHPSARQHEAMATVLEQAIRSKLSW